MADLLLKSSLGQIGGLGKQLGKGVVEESKKTVKSTVQQIGLEHVESQLGQKTEKEKAVFGEVQKPLQQDNKDMLEALYGSSKPSALQSKLNPTQQAAQNIAVQKESLLMRQLHKETYYDPTFNPQKKLQEEQVEKEQKKEDEEEKKRWELQEKKEKEKEESAVLQQQEKSVEKRPGAG